MEENKKRPNLILDPVKFTAAIYDNAASEDVGFSNYSYWRSTFNVFFHNPMAITLLAVLALVLLFGGRRRYRFHRRGTLAPKVALVALGIAIQLVTVWALPSFGGTDDTTAYGSFEKQLAHIEETVGNYHFSESFNVLLIHRPEHFEHYADLGFDLGNQSVDCVLVGYVADIAVSGNVQLCVGSQTLVDQILIDVRFVIPCVYDYCTQLRNSHHKGIFIYDFPSGCVYEYRTWTHQSKEIKISHSSSSIVKRNMHRHYLRVGKKMFQ